MEQEAIKFELKSPFAIIKKPESNEVYYTYQFPHKIMILGLLGSIIGCNGYNYNAFVNKVDCLPEFYEQLKELKISITMNNTEKLITKKIQSFNNTVGYANKDGNLIVQEQWLENPSWDIYVMGIGEKFNKIKEYLLQRKCEYIPYIGKNDHFADIQNVKVISFNEVSSPVTHISSLFDKNISKDYEVSFKSLAAFLTETKEEYEYSEMMPTALNSEIGYTKFKPFIFTNKEVNIINTEDVYEIEGSYYYFF